MTPAGFKYPPGSRSAAIRRRIRRQDYDRQYRAERRAWVPIVAGGFVHCRRCRELIQPGTPWDLGHDESRLHRAPEHRKCNRQTATHKAAARRTTREW